MKYYLAYGSNLSVEQMQYRCPDAVYIGTAELKGWRLLFKGSQSGYYLTIEKKARRRVPVLVWRVSDRDELALDRYEGFPRFYRKETMTVEVHSLIDGATIKTVDAFLYIMNEDRPTGRPSTTYYRICEEGYCRFGFDEAILKKALQESIPHEKNARKKNAGGHETWT